LIVVYVHDRLLIAQSASDLGHPLKAYKKNDVIINAQLSATQF